MTIGKVSAAGDHLARMVGAKPVLGLAELVWNSLDAEARVVDIEVRVTQAGAVDEVVVSDDGLGFKTAEVDELFGAVGGSWKQHAPGRKTSSGERVLHGEKGEGRWKAFALGDQVTWESVARGDPGGPNHLTRVTMRAGVLDEYHWDGPVETNRAPGTTVTVVAGMREPNSLLLDSAKTDLTGVVALYLMKYPFVSVSFNGEPLQVRDLIAREADLDVEFANDIGGIGLTVIEWDRRFGRKLYLCDAEGTTLHEDAPGIHAPGFDDFTAYVRWEGFRVHESVLPLAEMDSNEVGPAVDAAKQALRSYFRERAIEDRKSVVQQWRDEGVHPYEADSDDPVDIANQSIFNFVAVAASDSINRIDDETSKAFSLQTMKVALERDPSAVEHILQEVLKLPPAKIEEFHQLIQRTSLPAILDATRLVVGRLDFLAGLDLLLFDPDIAPSVLETAHIHKMIEREPWLFGEEYALHVSDRTLTALLRAHVAILGRDELVDEPVVDEHGSSLRRIDFMFGRALELNRNRREHLVVEIKRPLVTIGRDQIAQIEDYAFAVTSDSRFDRSLVSWDFVLLGTNLDPHAMGRARQADKPRGLIHDPGDGIRIWVKEWSEVIAECLHRLKFVRSRLNYDPNADEAMEYLRRTYPDYLPERLTQAEDTNDGVPL